MARKDHHIRMAPFTRSLVCFIVGDVSKIEFFLPNLQSPVHFGLIIAWLPPLFVVDFIVYIRRLLESLSKVWSHNHYTSVQRYGRLINDEKHFCALLPIFSTVNVESSLDLCTAACYQPAILFPVVFAMEQVVILHGVVIQSFGQVHWDTAVNSHIVKQDCLVGSIQAFESKTSRCGIKLNVPSRKILDSKIKSSVLLCFSNDRS
mmetsp:Transcript_2127/g.4803  ORF Transcript_2127/g.4803 Transcript_2127/m.4803 type:complete len:205 (-) Transcript_2127:1472-2086(-)